MSEDTSELLLAWTDDQVLAERSGYHTLADYLPGQCITAQRTNAGGIFSRFITKIRRRRAFSRWCQAGSFEVDRKIHRRVHEGFRGIIHYLWCDRDFAFLDLYPKPAGLRWVGTFHHVAEQLDQIISRPHHLTQFDAIILMSQTQKAWFIQHGVPEHRLHVILHGVDAEHFRPRENKSLPMTTQPLSVLAVGSTGRDFPALLATVKNLQHRSDICFDIIGPTHESAAFASLPNANYRSAVSDTELLAAYQSADCLIHLTTAATANNVLVEALACGLPVIANHKGGVPEYLNEECAILLPHVDAQVTSRAIEAWCSQPQQLAAMRYMARLHAETLAWPRVAKATWDVYQSLSLRA